MIWNIIDNRSRPYCWKRINAIAEATCHDNSCTVAAIVTKLKVAQTMLFTLKKRTSRLPTRSHGLTVYPAASPSSSMTKEEGPTPRPYPSAFLVGAW
jgi:hypothetical protein